MAIAESSSFNRAIVRSSADISAARFRFNVGGCDFQSL
jgi:hypothetical protein